MLFFFCLSQFLQYFPLLSARWADSEQGGREKAAEKERMERESRQGGGEVILESLNCNHHLQLLPPRCSNWTSTKRGRVKVEERREREKNTPGREVLVSFCS